MIVAGSMIGTGIFIVSADMARQVGSAGWLLGILDHYGLADASPLPCRTANWRP